MANGKLSTTAQSGKPLPVGIIHRADGSDVTDPVEFMENRSLFTEESGIDPPGPAAAHKGFGLAGKAPIRPTNLFDFSRWCNYFA